MKSVRELYKLKGTNGLFAYQVEGSKPCLYHIANTAKVRQEDGTIQVAYFYGEKVWSYSEEERDEYRKNQQMKKELTKQSRAIIKNITEWLETLDLDELQTLENYLENLEL